MFWLTILLIFMIEIKSDEKDIVVSKAYFLENDFWHCLKKYSKTDKGYLYGIRIIFRGDIYFKHENDFRMEDCFYLKYSNLCYAKFNQDLIEDFNSLRDSPRFDQKFIRFHFVFKDELIDDDKQFKTFQRRKRYYESYKWAEKSTENDFSINLKFDEKRARMIFIKENIGRFVDMKFLKLHEYTVKSGEFSLIEDLEKGKFFDLYHFVSYSECLASLKKFVDGFRYFRLEESNVERKKLKIKPTMKVTEFLQRFDKKIEKDLKKLITINTKNKPETFSSSFVNKTKRSEDALNDKAIFETVKFLIQRGVNDIKDKILKKDIFFQIGGKYNGEYYIDEIFCRIYKLAKTNQEVFQIAENDEKIKILNYFDRFVYESMKELQKVVIEDLFEKGYFYEHFVSVYGKNIKTFDYYAVAEKILCDYQNMLAYIAHCGHSFKKKSVSSYYYPPVFIDSYNCKIISGIEFRLLNEYKNDSIFIEAFDNEGRKVFFEREEHYFIQSDFLYCTSDILKAMNIEEINLISKKLGIIKRIKVNECGAPPCQTRHL